MITRDKGWVLVAGYGSIGRRHTRNLQALGVEDIRLLRTQSHRPESFDTPEGMRVYQSLDAALDSRPFAVIVANPTSHHVETTVRALTEGAHVVLEKPVAADLESARALLETVAEAQAQCSVAYNFRYHPLYAMAREWVRAGKLGRVFHMATWQSGYLPDWHPWEDYRGGYAARADLGGGVTRTLDHDLDFIRWTMGQPESVIASAVHLSNLEINVDDTSDMIFHFGDGRQAHAHVSFARRTPSRGVSISGEDASAMLDFFGDELRLTRGDEVLENVTLQQGYELNESYIQMLQDALNGFLESPPRAAIPFIDGISALDMAMQALRSTELGRAVSLTEDWEEDESY